MVTRAVPVRSHRATRVVVAAFLSLMLPALTRCAPARVWVVSGDAAHLQLPASTSFRAYSRNVAMLPGMFGDRKRDPDRAERICDEILGMLPDVVCLQEVFDEGIREIFSRRLAGLYPHRLTKGDGGFILKEDSGLFIASRYPFLPASEFFEPFKSTGPITTADAWAAKGILGAWLDLSALEPGVALGVFTTHLQADYGYSGEHADVRTRQLEQMRGVIDSNLIQVGRRYKTAVLLTGDLNVPGNTDTASEHRHMLEILEQPQDLAPGLNTWDPARNALADPNEGGPRQLDYMFMFADDEWSSSEPEGGSIHMPVPATPGEALSDHFALLISCVLV